jgi:hypothetical protein
LGVYFDEHLTFDHHTQYLLAKLNRSLHCINRAKNLLSKQALKSLYYALIHSHLTYCPIIISCAMTQNLNKLAQIQKKAIRIISYKIYNTHTSPLFKDLNILPFNQLLTYNKLLFMHSVIYKYSPSSFYRIWLTNRELGPTYDLRNTDELIIPHPRIKLLYSKNRHYIRYQHSGTS